MSFIRVLFSVVCRVPTVRQIELVDVISVKMQPVRATFVRNAGKKPLYVLLFIF